MFPPHLQTNSFLESTVMIRCETFYLTTPIGLGAVETSIASLIGKGSGKILKYMLSK